MKDKIINFIVLALLATAIILFIAAIVSFVVSFFIAAANPISIACFEWAGLTFMGQFVLHHLRNLRTGVSP